MHVHTNDLVISQSNSIANNKKTLSQFNETMQQGLSLHHQETKPHICNNMKNVGSFYFKFLRTHHAVQYLLNTCVDVLRHNIVLMMY